MPNDETEGDFGTLPGGLHVAGGLAALAAGDVASEDALLVCIAAPRLRQLGIAVPPGGPDDPERALYDALARRGADAAHGRYNALVREVVSFARAYAAPRPRRDA